MQIHSTIRRHVSVAMACAAAFSLAAPAAELEEIVVTARKTEERLQDVPVAVTAFSSKELAERNLRDVFDLAQYTPGFSFEKVNRYGVQGGTSRPVIRGMSSILGEGNASVFVDGILFSDSILAFPFDIVERVEIIKGPQAAQFGRATFSGAINLITKKGTNEPENRVSVRAAQFGDFETNLLSRGALQEDKLFYMAHARFYTMDGMYRNSLDGRKVGGEKSYNVNGGLEWRATDTFTANLGLGFSKDDDGHAQQVLQERFANNCYLNAPRQYYCGAVEERNDVTLDIGNLRGLEGVDRQSFRASLQLSWDFDAFEVISNSGGFKTDSDYGYDSTYQGATARGLTGVPGAPGYLRAATDPVRSGTVLRNEVSSREEWSTELRIQSAADARIRLVGGALYYTSERVLEERRLRPPGTGLAGEAPTVYSGISTVDNWAVFGQISSDVTERLNLSAEVRYAEDKIANTNPFLATPRPEIGQKFQSWSPRFTATFKATPANMVYANAALGNKPGVINADPRFPADIQFADEESAWNYEIGSKNQFLDGRALINLSVYMIEWDKQQLTTTYFFPTGGTQAYIRNAGKTEIKGLELETQLAVTDSFTMGFNYTYTDAKFKQLVDSEALELFGNSSLEGFQLPGVPEQMASLFGKLEFPIADFKGHVRADASFTDRKFAQVYNLAHTGEKFLMNLSAGLERGNWQVGAYINNLFDDRTPSGVTRYVDQLNLNVPQYVNANPAQQNVAGSTTTERAFLYALPAKRQVGVNLAYRF